MANFYKQFFCDSDACYSVIVEDDDRVAYAYLLQNEDVVSDVWLYNCIVPPVNSTWKENDLPFLNLAEFVIDSETINPIAKENDVYVSWVCSNGLNVASVFLHGEFVAELKPGESPGYSTQVKRDGPLARKYRDG